MLLRFPSVRLAHALILPAFVFTTAVACHPTPSADAPGDAPPGNADAPTGAEEPETPTPAARAKALVAQMTKREKIAYLGGDRSFYLRPIPRLGIPEIKMADGPVGCRNWGPSTAYPASIGVAATFDQRVAEDVGRAIGQDCRARGVHILLAPGVNIQRSPLAGRNFEYFGEDPLLAATQVVGFVEGVQEQGVLATVKHFVANNQEWDRHHVSSEVSERALREIYFPAFEAAVTQADVGAVMTAYNLVNGSYASHDPWLLREVLRNEWGFDGLVMSDWHAIHDAEGAVTGGTDLAMPAAVFMTDKQLTPLLESGAITWQQIDEKVENILRTVIAAGFFDRPQSQERPVDDPESAQIALHAARRSLVLLKNDAPAGKSEPLLPLEPATVKHVAVVGPNGHPAVHGGSGSAYTEPPRRSSLLDALRRFLPNAKVSHHPGVQEHSGFGALGRDVFTGPVRQVIYAGTELSGEPLLETKTDRINLLADGGPPAEGLPKEHYSIRWTGSFDAPESKKYQVLANADDGVRVFIDGNKVIDDWSDHAPRMSEADVFLKRGQHEVVVEYFQGILGSICQVGIGPKVKPGQTHGHQELKQLVQAADVVIVTIGYGQNEATNSLGTAYKPFWPPEWARSAGLVESEDSDRPFALPKAQRQTLELVAKTNPNHVVVGFAGGGVEMKSWIGGTPALLWAWYPGQDGGTALAEALLGTDPGGRLPVTFAADYADHPSADSYGLRLPLEAEVRRSPRARLEACADQRRVLDPSGYDKKPRDEGPLYLSPYCEGIFVGYRGFDHQDTEPLFPFGHGLSYATFDYGKPTATRTEGGQWQVALDVTNTTQRVGRTVVQIYVEPPSTTEPVPRAPRVLAGFAPLELNPRQTRRVRVTLSPRAFAYYSEQKSTWVTPPGEYTITASASSRDHRSRTTLQIDE